MPSPVVDTAAALERALSAPGWLVLGVLLHLANQVARGRGWYAIVHTACADGGKPRKRDVVVAWVAGAGAGGVVSARGGDAVRVLVLARRMPAMGSRAILTGTLVAETVGESAIGFGMLALALAAGIVPRPVPTTSMALYALAAVLGLAGFGLVARRSPRVRAFLNRARSGCSVLK